MEISKCRKSDQDFPLVSSAKQISFTGIQPMMDRCGAADKSLTFWQCVGTLNLLWGTAQWNVG
jgi:hypothetical protein